MHLHGFFYFLYTIVPPKKQGKKGRGMGKNRSFHPNSTNLTPSRFRPTRMVRDPLFSPEGVLPQNPPFHPATNQGILGQRELGRRRGPPLPVADAGGSLR